MPLDWFEQWRIQTFGSVSRGNLVCFLFSKVCPKDRANIFFWEGQSCNCNPARPRVADSGTTSYIEASCEISGYTSRRISSRGPTAASLPGCRRMVGGTTMHPYETLQIRRRGDLASTGRQGANQ